MNAKISAALCLLFLTASAWGKDLSLHGYAKTFALEEFSPLPQIPDSTIFRQTVRLKAEAKIAASLFLQTDYALTLDYQNPRVQDLSDFSYRAYDLNAFFSNKEKRWRGAQNLDRLVLKVKLPQSDFFVGRQSVAWGTARAINPTDVLVPYAPNVVDSEERLGIDALRYRIPLGHLSEWDMGAIFGEKFNARNSAGFLRLQLNWNKLDTTFLSLIYRNNWLWGWELSTSIQDLGIYAESAYTQTRVFARESSTQPNFFRTTIGADYNFTPDLYTFMEYHFNGAGTASVSNYTQTALSSVYQDGGIFYLSRHYLSIGTQYSFTALLSGHLQTIWNTLDDSVFLAPALDFNAAENLYLSAGAYLGFGKRSTTSLVQSEFGSWTQTTTFSLRYYF